MPAPYWFCLSLLLSAAGCGRLGVRLYRLDRDAGTQRTDAGVRFDAGQPPPGGSTGGGGSGGGSTGGGGSGGGGIAGTVAAADGGIDAGPSYQGDASIMGMMDTGVAMPVDGGNPSVDAGNPISCGGALQFGLCWYLADADTSCNEECADKGGFDSRAPNYIGIPSQGGSEAECQQVMTALGRPGTVTSGTQPQVGLGCHIWNNGDLWWWIQSPAFSPSAATPNGTGARIACACRN